MEDDNLRLFCGACGLVLTWDHIDDPDDVVCPDCGSRDIGEADEGEA